MCGPLGVCLCHFYKGVESFEFELASTCMNHENAAGRSSAGRTAFALILLHPASLKLQVNLRVCEADRHHDSQGSRDGL